MPVRLIDSVEGMNEWTVEACLGRRVKETEKEGEKQRQTKRGYGLGR